MWLKALIVILPTLPKFQKTFIYYSLLIYNLNILFFEKMVRMVRHHAKTLIYRHFAPLPKPLPNPYQPYQNKRCSMYESNFHAYSLIFVACDALYDRMKYPVIDSLIFIACDAFSPLVGNFPTYRESRFKRSPTYRGI